MKKNEDVSIVEQTKLPKSEGLNRTEKLILKTLVTDRIENRFQYAVKCAADMDADLLASCVEEIRRLQEIGRKLS